MQMFNKNLEINALLLCKENKNLEIIKNILKKLKKFGINIEYKETKIENLDNFSLKNYDLFICSIYQDKKSQLQKIFQRLKKLKNKSIILIGNPLSLKDLCTLSKKGIDDYLCFRNLSEETLGSSIFKSLKFLHLKKENEKLGFSQEKFKSLFNYLNDSTFFHDLKGNIIEVNDTACKRLNYSREELIRKNIRTLDTPKYRKLIEKRIRNLNKEGNIIFESEHMTKEGKIIPVEVSSTIIHYKGRKTILSIARDISLRKEKEEEHQEALKKYKQLHREMELILDHIPGLVFYKDTENNFLRVNKNLAEAHDMTKEEMMGKNCFEIFPKEQAQAYWNDDLEVIESGEAKLFIEEKWQTPDGLRYTSTSKIPFTNDEGETIGIIGFSIDLTEKKLIEKELIKTQRELKIRNKISNFFLTYRDEKLYSKILNYLLEVFEANIGFFSYINEEGDLICPTMKGGVWDKCNIPDKDIVFPKDSWGGLWGESLKKNKILVSEGPFNLPKGHVFLDNVICVPIIFQDVVIGQITLGNKTEGFDSVDIDLLDTLSNKIAPILDLHLKRKREEVKRERTQNQLKESEEKYRSILENIKEGYFEIDLKGHFEFFNDAMCEITGLTSKELKNTNLEYFVDEKTRRRLSKEFKEIYRSKKGKKNIEFKFKKNEDMERYIETSAYPLYNSNEKLIGYFGLSRDITKRKKAELLQKRFQKKLEEKVQERTKKLNQALEKQKKYLDQILKASQFKSGFLASMSHELRTPLNAIVGFTDLLLEESFGNLNEKQEEFLNDVKDSSKDLLNMINQVLDISKIEAGQLNLQLKEFPLINLINQIESTFKTEIEEKGLIFTKKGFEKINKIYADPIKLKQILMNLLNNAIKYTLEGKITLKIKESNNKWLFKVSDTGIGIAKNEYNLVFKEFQRGNSPFINSKKGTGLGLPLSKRLVNLHGGKIWFKSELGKGTNFYFTVPK